MLSCSSKCNRPLQLTTNRNLKQPLRELEVTMVVNSITLELMSCVMNLELYINSLPSTLHNQMALLRGRIELWLTWQDQCWVNTMWVIHFGLKQSTWLATIVTASIVTQWCRRHHMNSWMVESPILHIFVFLVGNATY